MTVDIATLGIRIDSSDARTAARDMENFRQAGSRAEQQAGMMSDVMKKLAGAFAAMKILDAASALVETQRTFDKLNSSLITATGSVENAGQAFAALQAFAASTPYGLNEVTKGFIQLRNLGLTPSEKALNSYGNTASAMGKSLNQMVEAVADAATGEFERLKEFGIRSKKNGDEIAFTFQGVTTTIENNATKIEQYLIGLGETRFAGGMELQAKTLDGAISNLGDTWESTKLKFSQSGFGDAAHSSTLALTAALADLGAILDVVTGAAKKEGEAVREASGLHAALTTAFETVAVLGVNVAYVFTQVGKELGGLAAQAAAVATGDLSLAKQIGVQMRAEAEAARVEVDAKTDAILGASAKARKAVADEAAAKQAAGRDDLAQYGMKQQASEKSAEALKKEGDAAKKAAKEYSDLIDRISGKSSGQDADFQKNIALLKNGYDAGKQSLSEYVETVETYIKQQKSSIDIEQEQGTAIAESVRRAQQGAAEVERLKASLAAASARAIEHAEQEADRNEKLVETFGMERSEIEALAVARLQEHLAQASSIGMTQEEITETEKLIVAKQRSAAALAEFEELSEQKQFWIDVDRTAHDTFVSIMDGSKSAAQRMKDTFKNVFFDWLYSLAKQQFLINVGTVMTGTGGAGTAAQAVGGASNALGAASNVSSLYSAATGGLVNTIGSSIAAAGNFVGSSAMSAFGAGFANVGGAAMTVSESFAAAGMAVEASAASIGAAFSAALPWIGGAVLAYKVLSKVFDKGPEQNTRLTFSSNNTPGNISINERGNEGKTGQSYIDGSSSGAFGSFGLSSTFWSDGFSDTVQSFIKTVTKVDDVLAGYLTDSEKAKATSAVTGNAITANLGAQGTDQNGKGELDGVFSARLKLIFESLEPGMAKLIDGFKGTAQELGTEAAALLQYRQALAASGEAVFGAKVTMQELAALKAPSEATSAALARVTGEFAATNAVATALGKTGKEAFGAVGLASLGAREQLITLSGGMDALGKNIGSFAQNYLSEAERLAPVTKAVDAAMAELGLSSITTREQFKKQVQGLDLTSEAGAKMFAQLMGLQDAFAQVHPVIASTTAAVRTAADIALERVELQKQYDQALMTDQEKARTAIAAGNLALFDSVQVRLAEKKAIMDAAEAKAKAAEELARTNAEYQREIDTILKGRMTEAQVRALETKGVADSTVALYDRLAALKAEEKAVTDLVAGLKNIVDARSSNADQMFTAQLGGKDLQGKIDLLKGEEKSTWAQVGTGADSVAMLEKIKSLAFQRIELEGQLQEKAIAGLKEQYSLREKGLVSELDAMVKMRDYAQQLLSFTGGLKTGDLSALNPTDKLAEAESQYRALLARANGGDEAARSGLQGSAQTYLQLQKQYSGSTQAYVSTYAGVIQDLEKLAGTAPTDPQIENQKLQISTIQSTSAALSTTVKDSSNKQVEVLKLIDAALAKAQAQSEAQIAQAGAANQALVEQLKKSHSKLAEIEARMARMEEKT